MSVCVCFVVLVIQHAIRVPHIVICDLSGRKLILYIHKVRDFRKKVWNLKCLFRVSLQISSESFPIIKRTKRDMIYNVLYWYTCKVYLILIRF